MNGPREAAPLAARRAGPADVPPVITLRADDGAVAEVHRHGAHVTSWRPMGEADDRLYLSARSEFGANGSDPRRHAGDLPAVRRRGAAAASRLRAHVALVARLCRARGRRHGGGRVRPPRQRGDAQRLGRRVQGRARRRRRRTTARDHAARRERRREGVQLHRGVAHVPARARCRTTRRSTGCAERSTASRATARSSPTTPTGCSCPTTSTASTSARPSALELRERGRSLLLEAEGFPDAVIWNPGRERAAALDDLEPGDERRFVCIEAAAVQTPVTLGAGRRWAGTQTLTAR